MTIEQSKQAAKILGQFRDGAINAKEAVDALVNAGMNPDVAAEMIDYAETGVGDIEAV